MIRPALLFIMLFFAAVASAQVVAEQPRTFRVPFHIINSLILLDGQLNGKPAVFLLDTGSNVSFVDMHVAGLIQ